MNTTIQIALTKAEAISAAWALKHDAAAAYCDERLTVASTHYSLAARLFFASGYLSKGNLCRQLAIAIDAEAIAIATEDDDAAEYASSSVIDLQQEEP
jgi:hypothetical protein